jgi:selenocysteine-specific elongation factor
MSTASPLLRVVIGTAGHVDHGKTALVRALTGVDTDRLPEEKRRGITLEAGYAHVQLAGLGVAGFVDVPGHERFLRAMVGAAAGVDVALLCVASDEGPMPQTAEHLDVLRLLGVQAGVVALTKSDLLPELGPEHRELVRMELQELLAGSALEGAAIVEVSARTGAGLEELKGELAKAVRAAEQKPRPDQMPLFLPVDRAFVLKGFGTVVTGTLFSGQLAPGDEVELLSVDGAQPRAVRVRSVQVHGATVERSRAGQRTAANLAGVEVQDVPRGSALVPAGTAALLGPSRSLDVELELLPHAARALRNRARVLAHLGCAQLEAEVVLVDRAQLLPGEKVLAQLRLKTPAPALSGLRFLLRGELGKAEPTPETAQAPAARKLLAARAHASTLGGGRVLAVGSRKRRARQADQQALQALASEDPLTQAERLVLEAGLHGASPALLAARGPFSPKTAERALERLAQAGKVVLFDKEARLSAHASLLARVAEKVKARLEAHTLGTPLDPSLGREEVRQQVGAPPPRLFNKALQQLEAAEVLRADAERLRPRDQAVPLEGLAKGKDHALLEKLTQLLDEAGLAPPRTVDLPPLLGVDAQRTAALLKALSASGHAERVSDELWFSSKVLAGLKLKLAGWLEAKGSIDAQGFKELTGQSRKFTIPLAEYFDRVRVTLRVGDKRVARKER